MATIKSLNQYKANYSDLTECSVMAESMGDALIALADIKAASEPSILQKTSQNVLVSVPDPSISIVTEVQGEAAATAGCKATPYSIEQVENGSKVYFTAIPADGWQFKGWYLNNVDGTALSTDESYEAVIEYAGTSPVTLKYIAQFATI